VKDILLKFNTGTPPGVMLQRLFQLGQIVTPRRLNDEYFEILLLLKSNKTFKWLLKKENS